MATNLNILIELDSLSRVAVSVEPQTPQRAKWQAKGEASHYCRSLSFNFIIELHKTLRVCKEDCWVPLFN